MNTRVFADKAALGAGVCALLREHSRAAISARGRFVVALSGGSLPQLLAAGLTPAALAELEPQYWRVVFADERCVPLDHADSNYAAAKAHCLDKLQIADESVLTITPGLSPGDAARDYEERLTALLGADGAVDVALLGMGPDGHTCSLFPGHPLLDKADTLIASIEDSPKPPPRRITFTYKLLNERCRLNAIVCAGAGKADMLAEIKAGKDLPVSRVANAVWLLDAEAAAKL